MVRVNRVVAGNFGDCKPLHDGVQELRIDHGPGCDWVGLWLRADRAYQAQGLYLFMLREIRRQGRR